MRKRILDCKTDSIEQFRRAAELAKELGMTHMVVSHIEESIWQWNQDRNDPYPNWGMYNPSIFRVVVPDELRKYLPLDYAERNFETISKRSEILKEYGLDAVFDAMEPAWLSEDVYRDHPSWRGPRCDQPRRARKAYYAPCTDNPEVEQLYAEAVYKLCKSVTVSMFNIMTNDSGGGICWSERLYPGANGPRQCRHLSVGDRAVHFLDIVQGAAAKAGVEAEAGYARYFTEAEKIEVISKLHDNQFCCGFTKDGSVAGKGVGILGDPWNPTYPVKGIPLIVQFAADMQASIGDDKSNITYVIPSADSAEHTAFLKESMRTMKGSTCSRYETLRKTAVSLIGGKWADALVDIWENIHMTQDKLIHLNQGGHMFMLGTVHQRWLTRPLVAFPSELSEDEKAYYRNYQFQAGTEEEADDLLNLQASKWLSGNSAWGLIYKSTAAAFKPLNEAIRGTKKLLQCDVGEYKDELEELLLRLRMYYCIITNAKNVVWFQSIIDRTDYEPEPKDICDVNDEQGDLRLYKIWEIVRDEIDNAYEMIEILDSAKKPVLVLTDSEENEDIMTLGPDIKGDLLKKISIMEAHKADFNRLYRTANL